MLVTILKCYSAVICADYYNTTNKSQQQEALSLTGWPWLKLRERYTVYICDTSSNSLVLERFRMFYSYNYMSMEFYDKTSIYRLQVILYTEREREKIYNYQLSQIVV